MFKNTIFSMTWNFERKMEDRGCWDSVELDRNRPGLAVLLDDGDAGDVGTAALVQVEVFQLERDRSGQEKRVFLRLTQPLILHVDIGYFRLFWHFLWTNENKSYRGNKSLKQWFLTFFEKNQ